MFVFKIVMPLIFGLVLLGCPTGENRIQSRLEQDKNGDLLSKDIVKQGQFDGTNGYVVNGAVDLFYNSIADKYSLVLSGFFSANGPELNVYISQGISLSHSYDLGPLKSNSGTLRYDFESENYDPLFDHILIWSKELNIAFGSAELVGLQL